MSAYLLDCRHGDCPPAMADSTSAEPSLLGVIRFSDRLSVTDPARTATAGNPGTGIPEMVVPMPVIGLSQTQELAIAPSGASCCEILRSNGAITHGQIGAIRYAHTQNLLFGVVTLTEREAAELHALQAATDAAYRQIFTLQHHLGFPHVWRFWNYMAAINDVVDELERYRQFNLGRQAAFESTGRYRAEFATAACALGFGSAAPSTGLCIAFIAGKTAPIPIENPRQMRAIDYPEQYGPRSPIFSRAALAPLGDRFVLFISGTASIVGHETLHAGDVQAQTRETLTNIETIVGEANRYLRTRGRSVEFSCAELAYRVYLRHPVDAPRVHAEMVQRLGQPIDALFLKADVCRQDLLVEIESCPMIL